MADPIQGEEGQLGLEYAMDPSAAEHGEAMEGDGNVPDYMNPEEGSVGDAGEPDDLAALGLDVEYDDDVGFTSDHAEDEGALLDVDGGAEQYTGEDDVAGGNAITDEGAEEARGEEEELDELLGGYVEDKPVSDEDGIGEEEEQEVDEGELLPEDQEEHRTETAAEAARQRAKQKQAHKAHEAQRIVQEVTALVIKMESAAEVDEQCVRHGEPAVAKLGMVKEVEEIVSRSNYHHVLLKSGFVGSLKAWLEPLKTHEESNGESLLTIPHAAVRGAVYQSLEKLNIRTENQEGRDYLRLSKLGPVLRFYGKIPHETERNRRTITALLNGWMLPIVEEGRRAFEDRAVENRRREEALRSLKRRKHHEDEVDTAEKGRRQREQEGKKLGDPGYRYRARLPRVEQPEYIVAPDSTSVRALTSERKEGVSAVQKRLNQVTQQLRRKAQRGDERSTKVELATKNVGHDIVDR